jgi:small-conductance mechanosensitive channel
MDNPLLELDTYGLPAVVILGGLVLGLLVRRYVLPRIAHLAARSAWHYDDVLVDAVRGPVVIWCVLLALHVAVRILPFSADTDSWLATIVVVLAIVSLTWAVARFANDAIRARSAGGIQGLSLIANVLRAVVWAVGLLFVAQSLGIRLTPILGALGVGGLAVGLAMQDTLGNFFAGIRLLASGKVRPGDYIQIEGNLEGRVADITWGQTTIQTLGNNIVIVPNSKLSQSVFTNFTLGSPELSVGVPLGVAYGSDLARVEAVALEVGRAVQAEHVGAVRGFEPVVRWNALGDSAVQLTLWLRATDVQERFALSGDAIRRLHDRFRAEGIDIPFPMRTVVVRREGE